VLQAPELWLFVGKVWKESKEGSPPFMWSLLFEGKNNNNREGWVPIVALLVVSFGKCSRATQRARSSPPQLCFRQLAVRCYNYNRTRKEKEKEGKEKEARKKEEE